MVMCEDVIPQYAGKEIIKEDLSVNDIKRICVNDNKRICEQRRSTTGFTYDMKYRYKELRINSMHILCGTLIFLECLPEIFVFLPDFFGFLSESFVTLSALP